MSQHAAGAVVDTGNVSSATTPVVIATILRPEGVTGVQTHVQQLVRYLRDNRTPMTLLTPFSWGRPIIAPVFGVRRLLERLNGPASVWWYRHWHEVFLRRALRRELATGGSCVVYAQCPVSARAALRARRGPHQRVVMAVHFRISQADEWADKGQIRRGRRSFRAIRGLERDVVPRVDGIVYVSEWGRDTLVSWLPEAATVPSAVIRNFVDPPAAPSSPASVADLVSVGNLEAVKNHRFLIDVLTEARRRGHVYTLDVFGEGPQRRELAELAISRGLDGQVRLRGFDSAVRDQLPGYRVCVHASYSESLPLAIIEAMAAGLPVVAGQAGGIAELIDDGVQGRIWPLDDPAAAADILISVMEDEPGRSAMAAAAVARYRQDFDAGVLAPQLLAFLVEAAASTP